MARVAWIVRQGYANPEDGSSLEVAGQDDLARSSVADMARRWRSALGSVTYSLLVLLPTFDAIRERNKLRDGHRRLREETLRTIYDDMLPWRQRRVSVIDNTKLTVSETVALIEQGLGEGV
jgi:hypothetical protein